jgi:hypothetical protein
LLVAYHFPPAMTAGALRWQMLLPLLADRGWSCDVLTLDPAAIPKPDWDRLGEVPETTRVFAVRATPAFIERLDSWRGRRESAAGGRAGDEGGSVASPAIGRKKPGSLAPEEIRWSLTRDGLRRMYGTLFVQRREAVWAGHAVRAGRALLGQASYAAVISSGPPHGAHLAGARLARAAGAPLVTDFRDPWAVRRRLPEAYASPLYFRVAARQERTVLESSSLVVATTDPIAASLRAAGARCPVITVMNGNDDEVFRSPPRHRFIIAYAGALYLDRDPRSLFHAMAELIRRTRATPDELELRLIGPVEQYAGRPTEELAHEAGVGRYVRIERPLARRALVERLAESSVLVSFPQDSMFAVPSKLFEYMSFEAWLLVLSAPGTPSAVLMADTDAAVVSPGPGDVERIREVLERWYAAFWAGVRPTLLPQRERFSRRAQARTLADALEMFRTGAPLR